MQKLEKTQKMNCDELIKERETDRYVKEKHISTKK